MMKRCLAHRGSASACGSLDATLLDIIEACGPSLPNRDLDAQVDRRSVLSRGPAADSPPHRIALEWSIARAQSLPDRTRSSRAAAIRAHAADYHAAQAVVAVAQPDVAAASLWSGGPTEVSLCRIRGWRGDRAAARLAAAADSVAYRERYAVAADFREPCEAEHPSRAAAKGLWSEEPALAG